MKKSVCLLVGLAIVNLDAPAAFAQRFHQPIARVGQCVMTRVTSVHQRLGDEHGNSAPGSGSAIELANGVYGVSYDQVRAVNRSRVGDRVRTCLISIPRHCPRGDDRGREYRTTNLRTHQSWTLPDSQHSCGGA